MEDVFLIFGVFAFLLFLMAGGTAIEVLVLAKSKLTPLEIKSFKYKTKAIKRELKGSDMLCRKALRILI